MTFVSKPKTILKTILLVTITGAVLYSYSSGPPPAHTGGFGEPTCIVCHNEFPPVDSGRRRGGRFDIQGVPDQYTPGATYTITVRISQPGQRRWGFELAARFVNGRAQAGRLIVTDALTQIQTTFNGIQYITHTSLGTRIGIVDGPVTWTFNWQAPAVAGGDVLFHAAGNAANGDGTPAGDYIYTDSKSSAPAGGGDQPYSVLLVDLNLDGVLDIVRLNQGSNNISILLGNGDGTFDSSLPAIPVGKGPWMVIARDVDGDGIPDLITANGQSNDVSVLLGNGDGTFADAVNYTVGGMQPRAVIAADFDGDEFPDLATANYNSASISVLINNGDGTFGEAMTYSVLDTPHYVNAGDFNGDGVPDLVVSNYAPGRISVLLGNGDGTFADPVDYPAGAVHPNTSVIADFDGDGHMDVAVVNQGSGNVSVLLGDGSGALGAPTTFAAGAGPLGLAAGDLKNDGTLDLVTANSNANNVSILLGDGAGGFSNPTNNPVGNFPRSVAIGDVDDDGYADIIVANTNDNSLSILFGDGKGGVARTITVR